MVGVDNVDGKMKKISGVSGICINLNKSKDVYILK